MQLMICKLYDMGIDNWKIYYYYYFKLIKLKMIF